MDKHRTNAASRGIGASRWDSQSLTIPTPTGEIDYFILFWTLERFVSWYCTRTSADIRWMR